MSGLGTMLRLAARRSRWFYALWFLALVSMLPATVSKYDTVVPAGSDPRLMMAALAHETSMLALLGPAFDLMSPGGFAMWRVGTFTAAAAAMMAALGVIRATRAEEEEGRTELMRSGAVARHAPLTAALALAIGVSLLAGLTIAALMIVLATPVTGSLLAGLGIGLTGATWAGVGAVCAQLFASARTARTWAVGFALGGCYLLRAGIDGSQSDAVAPLRWVVPLEWAALARPYAGDRAWVLLLPLALTVALVGLAYVLEGRRDHGAGLVHARLGRASGPASLSGAWGLSWRLQRSAILGWVIGVAASAAGLGTMALTMDAMLADNPQLAEMFRRMGSGAADLKTSFYTAMLGILATLLALEGVLVLARLRSEETSGHAEQVLATSVPRTRFALSHLVPALATSIGLLLACGLLLPLGQALDEGSAREPLRMLGAAAALTPGLLLVLGLAMLLHGWAPRLLPLVWALLAWTIFLTWLAPLLDLPGWLLRLHPWGHLPHLPTEALTWPAILSEGGVGLTLLVLGVIGYRRRDIVGR